MTSRCHSSALALTLMLVLPMLSPAADAAGNTAEYAEMSLEQLMSIPVYTAAKREQKTAEAPSSVTIITSQEIRAYGWRTLADLLRSVPGFYVDYPRTYGSIGVRGFNRPGDFGGRTLLLVNGHRLNDPIYDTAASMEDFIVDMDLIDRVEVVRGPGSALYGNNAFFAVINVITKRGGQVGGVEASGEAASYETYRGRLSYGAHTTNGTEALVSASDFTSAGAPRFRYQDESLDHPHDAILRHGDGEASRRLHGSLQQGGLSIEGFYVGRDKESPPAYGSVPGLPIETFDGRGFLEGRYERSATETVNLLARLYYDWYEYQGNTRYENDAPGPPHDFILNRDQCLAESVGSELQFDWRPNAYHHATVGLEYRSDYCQAMQNYADVAAQEQTLDVNPTAQIVGLYAQDEYQILTNLAFTVGLRYDHYETFNGTANPRLACVYHPLDATTLKLLYGTAFRAPNANELYYEDNGVTSKTNPGLQPETITTYEVVLEQRLSRNWRGSAAGFYHQVHDLINSIQDPDDGLWYYANMDEVTARGMEFQVDGQMTRKIRVRTSYTLTKTEDATTGEPLLNSPEHIAKLNLTVPIYRDWLFSGGEVQYLSERALADGQSLDDLWLFNLTLFSARLRDAWELSVSVYNVLDTAYRVSSSQTEADGRTYRVKLSTRF